MAVKVLRVEGMREDTRSPEERHGLEAAESQTLKMSVERFVILPDRASLALALWVVHSHCVATPVLGTHVRGAAVERRTAKAFFARATWTTRNWPSVIDSPITDCSRFLVIHFMCDRFSPP